MSQFLEDCVTYVCLECHWQGTKAETADDGPNFLYCCPECGSPDLVEERDQVGD